MFYSHYYPSSGFLHGSIPQIMNTRFDALLFGDEPTMNALWQSVTAEVVRLERLLNRFKADSELSRINRDGCLYPVGMSDELWDILQPCRTYYRRTDGCFDITLGRFGNVEWDDRNRTVSLSPDTFFDLGGYAKGYALQQVKRILRHDGVTRALVNFGDSTVLALGTHPCGDCWSIGVMNPYDNTIIDTVSLHDEALSVSGNQLAHPCHIVNAETGKLVGDRELALVVTSDPLDAEVLSTAWMSVGEEQPWLSGFEIKVKNRYKV